MYQAYRFSFRQSLWWTRHTLVVVTLYASAVTLLGYFSGWRWMALPWQPVGLIGVALAFYLGFKNNENVEAGSTSLFGSNLNSSQAVTFLFSSDAIREQWRTALHSSLAPLAAAGGDDHLRVRKKNAKDRH